MTHNISSDKTETVSEYIDKSVRDAVENLNEIVTKWYVVHVYRQNQCSLF